MFEFLLFLLIFAVSYIGVELFRRWTVKKRIFDVPNERSSHNSPKPRGGGLIFVIVSLVFYSVYTNFYKGDFEFGYIAAAVLITLISWLDDLFSISIVWRFIVHSAAALLIIYNYGYFDSLYLPFFNAIEIGGAGAFFTFCWIVWLTNAYNFMDGIDGIAGMQAFTAGLGWFFIGRILGYEEIGLYGAVVAFACAGFLLHNWQPAKIFMGDVGSAFLGFTFAVLPLLGKKENNENFYLLPVISVFLVWFFVFDSLFTFFRRLLKKKKVWKPHREHFYQKLVIDGYSHRYVTVLYGIFSLVALISILFWLIYGRQYLWLVFIIIAAESLVLWLYGTGKAFGKVK